jgi:transposase-like protein
MRRNDSGERPSSRSDLKRWYATALAQQERSGQSMAECARELGVTPTTLYQWRRRLSTGGAMESATGGGRSGLVELVVRGDQAGAHETCAVVQLSGGRRCIEVPRDFAADDLRRLVTLLESC